MTKEIDWNNASDIVWQYKTLHKTQGFKIHYKTIDWDGDGDEVIVSQIIPAQYPIRYSVEIPIQTPRRKRYATGIAIVGWDIGDKRFEINIAYITKIEVIDNPIEEIIKEILND